MKFSAISFQSPVDQHYKPLPRRLAHSAACNVVRLAAVKLHVILASCAAGRIHRCNFHTVGKNTRAGRSHTAGASPEDPPRTRGAVLDWGSGSGR